MKNAHSRVVVMDEVKIGICRSADKLIRWTPDARKFQIQDSLLKLMEKQNELIENSKRILGYSARETQKNGTETYLSPNSHTMEELIQLRNEPRSSSC